MKRHYGLFEKDDELQSEEITAIEIGARIRSIRKKQGLTIKRLAEVSQVSPNTISLIENDRTSPSLRTLGQLAQGLGVSLMALLEPKPSGSAVVYQRQGQREILNFENGTIENLGDGLPPLGAEPLIVTLEAGKPNPEDVAHSGREFVYCISGSVVCYIEGEKFPLAMGDSLLFEASRPHRWENLELEPTRMLVLFCPMDAHDHPAEKHLQ
jgi:transcriptional regulator with XRE-family HTH domain